MMLRKSLARRLSRPLVGVFAVQVMFASLCMPIRTAHAMPVASTSTHTFVCLMGKGCTMGMHGMQHGTKGHAGGCFHCDEPGQYMQAAGADLPPPAFVPAGITILPEPVALLPVDVLPEVQATTGPPGSFSLIVTTTRRIRI